MSFIGKILSKQTLPKELRSNKYTVREQINAVENMKSMTLIKQIALSYEDELVQMAAISKIDDIELLTRISSEDGNAYVREKAVLRLRSLGITDIKTDGEVRQERAVIEDAVSKDAFDRRCRQNKDYIVDDISMVVSVITAPFPADDRDSYIFVSYSHADKELVFPIIKRLYEEGWNLWFDEGLEIGDSYDLVLENHLKDSRAVMLFVTHNSVKSSYIRKNELPWALRYNKDILRIQMNQGLVFENFDLAEYPITAEDGIETALTDMGIEHGSKRKAVPRKIRITPLVETKDLPYKYSKCPGGVCLWGYDGNDTVVHIPEEYPPASGQKVVAIERMFLDDNCGNSVREVHIPPTVTKIGPGLFIAPLYLSDKIIYIPSTVTSIARDWYQVAFHGKSEFTIHCSRNSCAYKHAVYQQNIKLVIDPDMEYRVKATELYAYISGSDSSMQTIEEKLSQYNVRYKYNSVQDIKEAACFVAFTDPEYVNGDRIGELKKALKYKKEIVIFELEAAKLPSEYTSLFDVHQLTDGAGSYEERMVRLLDWFSLQGCRDIAMIPDFEYSIDENGGLVLEKYHGGPHAVISSHYGGVPVRAIASGAFINCGNLLSVELPEGIKRIGESAFEDCNSLLRIYIPDSVNSIGAHAFDSCCSLKEVHLPESIRKIEFACFSSAGLEEVYIPQNCEVIGSRAFYTATLKKIIIPDGLKELDQYAITGDKELEIVCGDNQIVREYCRENGITFQELK